MYLGDWLRRNGEAIYGTRPFERQMETAPTGETLYYTRIEDTVYAFIADSKPGASSVALPGFDIDSARVLGGAAASFVRDGDRMIVNLVDTSADSLAIAIAIGRS